MFGQVTAVINSICRVAWAPAPSTDHANGAWPCFVEPRKEMVGNRREGEPDLLGTDRVTDQGGRPVFLWISSIASCDTCITSSQPCSVATARSRRVFRLSREVPRGVIFRTGTEPLHPML